MSQQQQFIDSLKEYVPKNSAISLVIPPTKKLNDISDFLTNEIREASSIKSKSVKDAVQTNLKHIQNEIKIMGSVPSNGVAIYAIDGTIKVIEPIQCL